MNPAFTDFSISTCNNLSDHTSGKVQVQKENISYTPVVVNGTKVNYTRNPNATGHSCSEENKQAEWRKDSKSLHSSLENFSVKVSNNYAYFLLKNSPTGFFGDSSNNIFFVKSQVRGNKISWFQKKIFHFSKYFQSKLLSNILVIQLERVLFLDRKKFRNFMRILSFAASAQYGSLKTKNINQFFLKSVQNLLNYNYISWSLKNEQMLNLHLFYREQRLCLCAPGYKGCSFDLKNTVSSMDFKTSVFTCDMPDGSLSSKQEINLTCFFTNTTKFDDIPSDFGVKWKNEDIKMIVPTNWKIVVTCNILTISDGNNGNMRIFFRNPLKICFDYEKSNISLNKTNSGQIIMPASNAAPESYSRIINLENARTACNEFNIIKTESINFTNKTKSENANKGCVFDPLPLEQPLLLKCTEGNKRKQIMMYKAQSLRSVSGNQNRVKSSKTLENLFKRSVMYEGDPIYLVFNPQKAIQTLKRKERLDNGLICVHPAEARLNLTKNSIPQHASRNENVQTLNRQIKANKRSISASALPENTSGTNQSNVSSNHRHDKCKQDSYVVFRKNFSDSDATTMKNELETGKRFHPEDKPKLKIRRRKKTRAALKRVNVRQIVSSVFHRFFHSYALLGGHLKSGAVITRSNSNHWLKVSGVVTDSCTLRLAGDLFTAVAGTKVVLNIYDYLRFLTAFARNRKIIVAELVKQMMVYDQSINKGVHSKKKQDDGESHAMNEKDGHLESSRSLPNLKCAFSG